MTRTATSRSTRVLVRLRTLQLAGALRAIALAVVFVLVLQLELGYRYLYQLKGEQRQQNQSSGIIKGLPISNHHRDTIFATLTTNSTALPERTEAPHQAANVSLEIAQPISSQKPRQESTLLDNYNVNCRENNTNNNDTVQLLVSRKELQWIQIRPKAFAFWYNSSLMDKATKQRIQPRYNANLDFFRYHADTNGPWLDFLIAGFPKCGTTTLMATLGRLAPMPIKDVCVLPPRLLKMAYEEWPSQYGKANEYENSSPLLLRGSKCPALVGNMGGAMMKIFSNSLPRTKYIIGIRHPILWFQSFWRMQGGKDPYQRNNTCSCKPDRWGLRLCQNSTHQTEFCWNECGGNNVLCLARSRFHVALAQLGKTNLTETERQWLAPNDFDGGKNIISLAIPNPIFLYDLTQLQDDELWTELASFLHVSKIPQPQYQGSKGKALSELNLCDAKYDAFRATVMLYSYDLSVWLIDYFLPTARDASRMDVVVANPVKLTSIFQSYKQDPCKRLIVQNGVESQLIQDGIHLRRTNLQYVLDPTLKEPKGGS